MSDAASRFELLRHGDFLLWTDGHGITMTMVTAAAAAGFVPGCALRLGSGSAGASSRCVVGMRSRRGRAAGNGVVVSRRVGGQNRVGHRLGAEASPGAAAKSVREDEDTFFEAVAIVLKEMFDEDKIARVLAAWHLAQKGTVYEKNWDPSGQNGEEFWQRCGSFIEGLDARPFHDPNGGNFPWVHELEQNWETIRDELRRSYSDNSHVVKRGVNVWVPAVKDVALEYGPDWRTLVLQDRVWEPTNSKLFSKTTKIVKDAKVPSVEVFFARQGPQTGIKPHTDNCNFIMTAHLALDAPPNQSWIKVGGEQRFWENGKALVFDTSFTHSTFNESSTDTRYVLLIRFWHPQLMPVERKALQFIFDAVENPALVERELKVWSAKQTRRTASDLFK
ncbi:Aspartyl/asparaginyl beta-hydroxylase [Porphyridium purpureum]|uniref:Aspartyl/asparaginyl beta-hydroxylase n=1 Tax=Porphyridium purpureum TaxID=35688 RepID=A0A5J4Z4R2_PORPP|nr:Aspartyl/asparaginyl beta-hydroxylase [Porphyridium purpureum]|eukprot:POR5933..scf295_1